MIFIAWADGLCVRVYEWDLKTFNNGIFYIRQNPRESLKFKTWFREIESFLTKSQYKNYQFSNRIAKIFIF